MMIKGIQTFDKITTYLYGASVFKVCENEMIHVCKAKETLRKINIDEDCKLLIAFDDMIADMTDN